MVIQPDGQIVVAGISDADLFTGPDFALARYLVADPVPPETTITSGPTGTITTTTASFTWTGLDDATPTADLTYAFRLDPQEPTFSAFGSAVAKTYTGLANGNYTLHVKARDQAGNEDATPATQAFTVTADTTPPDTTITSGPTGTITVDTATFGWTGSDNVTPPASLTFAFRLHPLEPDFSAFGTAVTKTYTALANGDYTFYVKARDQAGNEDASPASRAVTVAEPDTTAPDTTITSGPTGTIAVNTATFGWTGSDSVTPPASLTFAFRLHPLEADFSAPGSAVTKTYTALANGDYTFYVKARDQAGNEDATPATQAFTVTVDTTPPDTTITSGPTGPIIVNTATFGWTGSDDVTSPASLTFAFRLHPLEPDFSAFGTAVTKTYSGLANGDYTLHVKARDQATNEDATPATRAFTVNAPDTTAPDTTITSGPTGTIIVNTATFGWTGSDDVTSPANLTFAFRLHPLEPDFSAFGSTVTKTYSGLANGDYTLHVKARDQATNEDATPATRAFTVNVPDTTAPDTTITSGPTGTIIVNTATFGWTGSDDVTSPANLLFAYRLDPGEPSFSAFGPAVTKTYTGLANGNYTFQVKARDQATNEDATPASQAFIVNVPDNAAPDTTITSGPTGTITVNTATFGWTGSDNVTSPANLVFAYRLDPIEPSFSAFGSTVTKTYTGLADGNYIFQVKARDQATNEDATPASQAFIVNVPDIIRPDTTITSGPSGTITVDSATFGWTGSDNVTSPANLVFAYRLDPLEASFSTFGSAATKTYTGLPNDDYTFLVMARDQATNEDATPASRTFTVAVPDTTLPETTITSGPTGTITVNTASFSWTGSDDGTPPAALTFAYRLDPVELSFSAFGPAVTKTYTDLANGSYTLLVMARDQATNEDATPASRAFTVAVGQDLVEVTISSPPPGARRGEKFTVNDVVQNLGSVTSKASRTRYYFSQDSQKGTGDKLLTPARSVPPLTGGATHPGTVKVTIPLSTPFGVYYLLACADDNLVAGESNETNNCLASATTIVVGDPDLIESSVSNPPATVIRGATFDVTDTTRNARELGGLEVAATETRYYLSVNTVKNAGDKLLTGVRPVPILAPGASSMGTVPVTVPSNTAPGTYYLLACADDTKLVAEAVETNNCTASSGKVTVAP